MMKRYASVLLSLLLVTDAFAAGNLVDGDNADLKNTPNGIFTEEI